VNAGGPEVLLPNTRSRLVRAAAALTLFTLAACGGGSSGSSGTALGVPPVPAGLEASAVSAQSVTLTWSPAAGATAYLVRRDGTTIATPTTPTYTDATVGAGATYAYAVVATNGAGASAASTSIAVTTPAALPTSPVTPTGLVAIATSNTNVHLSWTDTGPTTSGAVVYRIYRDGVLPALDTATAPAYDDTVAQASTHSYTVQAFDPAGHSSAQSAAAAVTTPGPTVPGAVTALAAGNTRIAVSWSASSDTLPITSYLVSRDGVQVGTVTVGTAYTDATVAQASIHSYTVVANDGLYRSAPSAPATAQTPGPTAPVVTLGTVATGSVTLNWTASADTLGTPLYRILRGDPGGATTTLAAAAASPYTDSSFTLPGTYAYTVVAYDSAGYTAASNRVSTPVFVAAGPALSVSPAQVALTAGQSQRFTASAAGGAPTGTVTFSVDDITGGNTTVGTIDSTGLYSAPATPGKHAISASTAVNAAGAPASAFVSDLKTVATYHYDSARTGQNLAEYALTPATLTAGGRFGKLFSCAVDGDVYAQPLYVAQLTMVDGLKHNVVFVATMHDSVYAFDADAGTAPCSPLWVKKYATNGPSVQPVPVADTPGCSDIHTEYGITGTPVIDTTAGLIYFVTKTKEGGHYYQRLHALDISSGNEPVPATEIKPASFDPLWQNQRAGLALANGRVYVSWAAHCDLSSWHGWMMAFDATTRAQVATFNSTPAGSAGGIWMAGGAPAVDAAGNLYVTTGNGSFDYSSAVVPPLAASADYGESYLKLDPNLTVADFYTPGDNVAWTSADLDLSSSAVTVLPDLGGGGAHTQLIAGSDKQRHLWLLDRQAVPSGSTAMGGFDPADAQVYRYVNLPNPLPAGASSCSSQEVFGTPTYYTARATLYVTVDTGGILAVPLATVTGAANFATIAPAATSTDIYGFPSPTSVISAAGAGDTGGVLWALDNSSYGGGDCNTVLGPAVLRAYDAATLARLYSSDQLAADQAGNAIKFQQPVVANGHVYVAGAGTLTVYGLLP
jgi:fibronectin type 3 domain-containing protein